MGVGVYVYCEHWRCEPLTVSFPPIRASRRIFSSRLMRKIFRSFAVTAMVPSEELTTSWMAESKGTCRMRRGDGERGVTGGG